jgi:hypothetical protein
VYKPVEAMMVDGPVLTKDGKVWKTIKLIVILIQLILNLNLNLLTKDGPGRVGQMGPASHTFGPHRGRCCQIGRIQVSSFITTSTIVYYFR